MFICERQGRLRLECGRPGNRQNRSIGLKNPAQERRCDSQLFGRLHRKLTEERLRVRGGSFSAISAHRLGYSDGQFHGCGIGNDHFLLRM